LDFHASLPGNEACSLVGELEWRMEVEGGDQMPPCHLIIRQLVERLVQQ
jgi:hypothetical protein